jgi:hypothetical protein
MLDAAGKPLPEDSRATTDLANLISGRNSGLQALPDGRILVASVPAQFPLPASDTEIEPSLFLVSPTDKKIFRVPTAPGALPTDIRFTLAPDGKRVAVTESQKDAVAVVELATGKVDIISPAHDRWDTKALPAWKSGTELTFAALHEGKPSWMLWNVDGTNRCLSERWPPEATAKWMSKSEEKKP